MFYVYFENGVLYYKTLDEIEADLIACMIGGFYVESGAY